MTGDQAQQGFGAHDPGAGDVQQLEREIEQTRRQLGDTVAALARKSDLRARAGEAAQHVRTRAGGAARRHQGAIAGVGAVLAALILLRRTAS